MSMRKEPEIRAELYRVLKNSIEKGISLDNFRISKLAVEYPINGKKADLVVFFHAPSSSYDSALLTIETKGRRKYPAMSLARASKQVMNYSKKLSCSFFAVYDGWNFLLFHKYHPHLLKLSSILHFDESIARNLLLGILEHHRNEKSESLKLLPKIPDGWSFQQTILPSIAKMLASITNPELEDSWKILHGHWTPIIKRDGEW